MPPDRSQRNSKLMQIFDLQNDFLKHRQKILKTQRKDVSLKLKKNYNSQIQMINSFRKNWINSSNYKQLQKQKQISHCNRLLQQSIIKQYNRDAELGNTRSRLNRTAKSNSSSRLSMISTSEKKRKIIEEENTRLLKKIVSIESDLSRDKMSTMYQKTKANKERLEVFSSKNKQRLKKNLNKMHIEPTVYFPKMRAKFSTMK